ncbi:hypothetical protein B0O80DRAFT_497656 [Mortierella sp. GBAus27b]|nr:hypothetical protein BGX31_002026 [Mortierella sp. GBA43]KAI8355254.1 hypothetical protein B0O80DRAFT_497656 [Mortierella sp. GBAus27b]
MVTIALACVATDGISLYGLSVNAAPPSSSSSNYYVIVKSNPNPSPTLSDLSWTVVSSKAIDDSIYALVAPNDVNGCSCAIDDTTKVFTAMTYQSRKLYSDPPANVTRGIQYQPDSGGGTGTWTNIETSPDYQWRLQGDSTQLYEFKDSTTGKTTLMHAYVHIVLTKVYVAAMDSATLTMNQNRALWAYNKTLYGEAKAIVFSNNQLHTLGALNTSNVLTTVPIYGASTGAPPPSAIKAVDATIIGDACGRFLYDAWMSTLENKVVIFCRPQFELTPNVFTFDGTAITALPQAAGGIRNPHAILAMPGAIPFLLMVNEKGLHSIQLSGPSVAQWNTVDLVSVADSIFDSPKSGGSGTTTSSSDSHRNILIGTLLAAAVLVILFGYFCWRRKRRSRSSQSKMVDVPEDTKGSLPFTADSKMRLEDPMAIQPPVELAMKLEDPSTSYHGQTLNQLPYTGPWQSQGPAFSTHPRPTVTLPGANNEFQESKTEISPTIPTTVSVTGIPRGPAMLLQPAATPQAVQSIVPQLPGPHTEYHDDGNGFSIPLSAGSATVQSLQSEPGAPQCGDPNLLG